MDNFFKIKGKKLLSKCPPDVNPEEWKIFRNNFDLAGNYSDLGYPIQLDIELNGGCNMSCPFCLHGYEDIPNIELSLKAYREVIKQAVDIGVKSIKFNYINEPMLRKDLESCIKYAKEQGIINVYMVTNGTVLNKKRRESLLASGITKVFVSLDATTKETYEKQRLSGMFEKVKTNIKEFIKLRNSENKEFPLVRVSFLKNSLNIHEAPDFEKEWSGVADIINFQTMNEVPDMETGLLIEESIIPEKGCNFPFKQLVVDHLGNIQPCCKLDGKKLIVGNIKDMTLKEAWNSDKYKRLRELHKGDGWKQHPVCFKCMVPNYKEKTIKEDENIPTKDITNIPKGVYT